ncbi:MAG TPA: tetratricopeptide repeat protein [Thermoanaerobaculia bacterium]|nr:tetratricopeptide repeat protein [Thermoanaerobaculia bacterium]
MIRPAAALLLAALITPIPGEPPVSLPDLSSLEPAVAEQIAAAERRLGAALAALTPDPRELARAYGELGGLFHAYRLAGPAAACYANAERLDPQGFRWPHLLGLLEQEAGRLAAAEAAYGRALERAPGDLAALVDRGEVRLLAGRTAAAEADLKQALAAEPTLTAARALLGQAALAGHRYEEAVQLFTAALAEVPAADRLHYPLALAYRGLGDGAKAADHLARAGKTGVRPADPLRDEIEGLRTGERVHLARGKAAVQAGRPAEAVAEFRRALAARPESVAARINLASVLASQGDRTGALALLREAVRADPANPTARYDLGLLLAAGGEAAAAREQLAAAVAAQPEDAEAHRALAQVLRDGGDLPGALAEYDRAVALAPADDVARLGEGETLVRLGRLQAARDRLEEGRRALPESGLLAHGLARLLAGSPDPALRDGRRALTLAQAVYTAQPSVTHAATVALALAELGRCAEAADWQKKALAEAERTGLPGAATAELTAALARYGRGTPCRPPVMPRP